MLNSAEHENFSAYKYENANLSAEKFSCSAIFSKKEFRIVSNLRLLRGQISCSAELSMKKVLYIKKTCLYNFDPLKPHFYIVKLGFTGVYIIFVISAQKHRLQVLVRTALNRRF